MVLDLIGIFGGIVGTPFASSFAASIASKLITTIALKYIPWIKNDEVNSKPTFILANNILLENNSQLGLKVLNRNMKKDINELDYKDLTYILNDNLKRNNLYVDEFQRLFDNYITNLNKEFTESSYSKDLGQKGFIELKFGNIYHDFGMHEKSIEFYNRSINSFIDVDNKLGHAKAQYNLALAYALTGQIEEAESRYILAYELFDKLGEKTPKVEALLELGNIYYQKGLANDIFIGKAIETYEKALAVDTNNHEYTEKIWHNLANCKYERGYLDEALEIYKCHLPPLKESNTDDQIIISSNLATIYFSKGYWKQAIDLYKDYLGMDDSNELRKANVLFNLAYSYFKLEDLDNSVAYYKSSHELFSSLNLKHLQGKCSLNLGICYRHMGDKNNLIDCLKRSLSELDKQSTEYEYVIRLSDSITN